MIAPIGGLPAPRRGNEQSAQGVALGERTAKAHALQGQKI